MDRKFIQKLTTKQINCPYPLSHFPNTDSTPIIRSSPQKVPFHQNVNTATESLFQQREQTQINKRFGRAHRRGYSEGVERMMRDSENKQNNWHKQIDRTKEGEDKIKNLDEKVRQLEQRVLKAEKQLFDSSNKQKQEANSKTEIVQIVDQRTNQKFSQVDETLQKILIQIQATKSQLQDGKVSFLNHSDRLKYPQCPETTQIGFEIDQKLQFLYASVRNQFQAHFCSIQEKIKKISPHKEYEQALNIEPEFFRTNRKYSGNPISFLYEEYIRQRQYTEKIKNSFPNHEKEEEEGKIQINQITYYIDGEGFLLDNEGLYLVNSKNMQIKLSERQLRMLRKANILGSP